MKSSLELENKNLKESLRAINNDFSIIKQEQNVFVNKVTELTNEVVNLNRNLETTKATYEKQLKELKTKSRPDLENSELLEARRNITQLQTILDHEKENVTSLRADLENSKEESILVKAQFEIERNSLELELNGYKQKISNFNKVNVEKSELNVKLISANKTIKDLEMKILRSSSMEFEKTRLKNRLNEKETEYKRLKQENDMNIDLVSQLRRDVEHLNGKLTDFDRISRARSSVNDHNNSLENEIRTLRRK